MKAWKFVVPQHEWVPDPDNPEVSYRGCVAVAVGDTAAEARAALENYAAMNGFDVGWLRVARVLELNLVKGSVIAWAQL